MRFPRALEILKFKVVCSVILAAGTPRLAVPSYRLNGNRSRYYRYSLQFNRKLSKNGLRRKRH